MTRDSCLAHGALCLLLWAGAAIAHQAGTTGYADISVSGQMVRYSLTLSAIPPSPLAEEMRFGQPGETPNFEPLGKAIAERVHLTNDGQACEAGPRHLIPPTATVVSVTAIVDFVCPGEVRELAIRDDLFDAIGNDVHTLAKIEWPDGMRQFTFSAESRDAKVSLAEKGELARGAGSFFLPGIEHILSGYDHLLFLLALILCGGGLWSLLKIITAFTVAHGITLALPVLGVLVAPNALVGSVIALSIAYVAMENLLPRYAVSRRWAVSFLFGLAYGFDFSPALREIGLPKENLALSLLNFSLGVEAGQLIVVLLVFSILTRLKSKSWEPRMVATISGVLLALGLVLFVDRAFFGG